MFKNGRHWILIIVGFLVADVIAGIVLVVMSSGDPSHVVVSDYYAKALRHDDAMAQQRANQRLGWRVQLATRASQAGIQLVVHVADRDGHTLRGLEITLSGYHRARAHQVVSATLHEDADGYYRAPLATGEARPGVWQFALEARRGSERFTTSVTREVGLAANVRATGGHS